MVIKIHFSSLIGVFLSSSSAEVSPGDEILTLLETTTIDLKELERDAACLPPEDGELDGRVDYYSHKLLFGRAVG